MPCYLQDNVDKQRGKGVYDGSVRALQAAQRARLRPRRLRASRSTSSTIRSGPRCRRRRLELEADYKRVLGERFGIVFNSLFTLANMPIQRFGAILLSKGEFDGYLDKLTHAHRDENLDGVMCRSLLSVDYRGYVYDCDFNQMLDLPLARGGRARVHLSRAARRRHRRQSDPRRRPLLRLHRRPGLELRRRAEGGGGVNAPRTGGVLPSPLAAEGRGWGSRRAHLPADYRYPVSALNRAPDFSADILYVVGGLYGNFAALGEIERLAARERGRSPSCSTATIHWFDAEPHWFAEIERGVARHRAIRGNVETEIARARDIGAGCGCAYPDDVDEGIVTRSNEILAELREIAAPADRASSLAALPMHLVAAVGGLRVGIVHGDAASLAGWRFAHDALDDPASTAWLAEVRSAVRRRCVRLDPHLPCGLARIRAARTADRHQQWRRRNGEFFRHDASD